MVMTSRFDLIVYLLTTVLKLIKYHIVFFIEDEDLSVVKHVIGRGNTVLGNDKFRLVYMYRLMQFISLVGYSNSLLYK
jgi:hypothetical protein